MREQKVIIKDMEFFYVALTLHFSCSSGVRCISKHRFEDIILLRPSKYLEIVEKTVLDVYQCLTRMPKFQVTYNCNSVWLIIECLEALPFHTNSVFDWSYSSTFLHYLCSYTLKEMGNDTRLNAFA